MKFKPDDMVMLLGVGPCRCVACEDARKVLAPGMIGTVREWCLVCTVLLGNGEITYHVNFSAGRFSIVESLLKKVGDDPDAVDIERTRDEPVAA